MADNTDPIASKSKVSGLLPKYFQTDSNKKFIAATIDQLLQPGTVKKINGYIGKQNAKSATGDDIFISAADTTRQNYQLEPGFTIKDRLDNTVFFKDYQDYINQIGVFGGNTTKHPRINSQEYYSWDPHICWDKFVNFQNYYWLPYGPDTIQVKGIQEATVSTYTVQVKSDVGYNTFVFSPDGLTRNPTIELYRGNTYIFEIDSPNNPFTIKTKRTNYDIDVYRDINLENNSIEQGRIIFTVPVDAPNVLYYVSSNDINLGGVFQVLSPDENTTFDVENTLLGKKTYTLPDGTKLSNGMKLSFAGKVVPETFSSGEYYVEGIGDRIRLVKATDLELISSFSARKAAPFDEQPFDSIPFEDATSFAGNVDYVTINRASADKNPWSRYNRWFHKDTISASATYNGNVPVLDQSSRALRPIIEFEADLQLFNFGSKAVVDVDVIDDYTTDVFSNIEGQLGYIIDGVSLSEGQRVLFTADNDRLVKNKIFKVELLTVKGQRQIHLAEEVDPVEGQLTLVKRGNKNKGLFYWYDGSEWKLSQQKTAVNQSPLFDVFDTTGTSYSNLESYDGSTFRGSSIFSYKQGTGTNDTVLKFPLAYKTIDNIGDIVFNFNLASDYFEYKEGSILSKKKVDVGFLIKNDPLGKTFLNGWKKCSARSPQAALRIYRNSGQTNNFDIDIFDDITKLSDLVVKLYINGLRVDSSKWSIEDGIPYKTVVLDESKVTFGINDVLTIRAFSSQQINSNGFYEIPVNMQNNPLNEEMEDFTLGEVIDHVGSIVDNLDSFSGEYPGAGNLRDLGFVAGFGTKFVQHSGPMSLSVYHLTSETNNVIRALEKSRDDYTKFKKNFISVAESLGIDTDPVTHVSLVMEAFTKDKPNSYPYYFSDMIPFSANIKNSFTVIDYRIKTYPISTIFNLDELSNRAVIVYLNGEQLLYGKDYTFTSDGFVSISAKLTNDDTVTIYEYENTNGCFVPSTPTKLGLWPKYEPKIFVDTTLITPRTMIQGHDGSLVLAYGDYRDDLILELEKRIYNNIKVKYDPNLFDVYDVIPSYNRDNEYTLDEFNEVLSSSFYKWSSNINRDFSKPLSYDRLNSLTFNYRGFAAPDNRETPGYWRGVYRWMFDTDRPNLCPWEMLGFSEQPEWWEETYGPAPYTSENKVLWKDLAGGLVHPKGKSPIRIDKFVRPYLFDHIPVDEQGNIKSPILAGLAKGIITESTNNDFIFGDVSPVEATWRRSSHYSFSVLLTFLLLKPTQAFSLLLDRSRVVRNVSGQIVYKDTGRRISPQDIVLPAIYTSKTITLTSGIINYLVDYIVGDNLKSYEKYAYDLKNISARLSHRLGAYTSKEKFNLLLDSKTPLGKGSVFVPQDDYDIILNSSSPIKKIIYSGVIITKLSDGFEVKGYSKTQPYFKSYPYSDSGRTINVGGISESFVTWSQNSQYAAGKIVEFNGKYFRSTALHTTTDAFNPVYYEALPSLPVVGGQNVITRKGWYRDIPTTVPYGTKFVLVQEVYDFLVGYGEYLKDQGFIFDEYNAELAAVTNWETSAREFLFWTTQNWSTGQDKWDEWIPDNPVAMGAIVRYNGDYYRALMGIPSSPIFQEEKFVKLDGLSTVGSSVISLSPAAARLTFTTPLAIVDDIRNPFNGYEIFTVDGTPIPASFINSYREESAVSYSPTGEDGIYCAVFYLVQKEQVVIFKNTTMFNDTIYAPTSGYRQERIKVSGYISTDWNGSFNVPGFIFDQAKIQDWEVWKDYALGDIVKYKEYFYTAQKFIAGTEAFDSEDWIKLDSTPTPQLLPNWTYKANQFTDFYNLDSDNFDPDQQATAQHLIGYQKRQYLENIIQDDVSEFKFYQGMIIEKGTQNVLNKLFDVLSADNKESIDFYEEWALRVGQYGANAAFETIEFSLDQSKFKNNPQGFELTNYVDPYLVDFIYRQTPNDVYLKPNGYDNNPWPIKKNFIPYLRTPGHARPDEVKLIVGKIDDILTKDPSTFNENDYIWVGFEGKSWNVYSLVRTGSKVVNVIYDGNNKELNITTDSLPTVMAGDIISLVTFLNTSKINGFYKVKSVSLTNIVAYASLTAMPPNPFADQESTVLSILESRKTDSIDNLDAITKGVVNDGDRVWTDDAGDGLWGSWQYNQGYSVGELVDADPQEFGRFGRTVTLNNDANIALVSNNLGDIVVYDRAGFASPWIQRQTIEPPFVSDQTKGNKIGEGVVISPDSRWLVLCTPTANNAREYLALNTIVADNDSEAIILLDQQELLYGPRHGLRENVVYARRTGTPDLYQLRKYIRTGAGLETFQWVNYGNPVTVTAPPLACYEQVNGVYTGKLKYVTSANPAYSSDLRLILDANDVNLLVLATGWVPKVVIDLLGLTFVTPITDGIYPTIDSTGKITSFPRLAHLRELAGQVITILASNPIYFNTIVVRVVEIFTSLGLIPPGSTLEQILAIVTNTITLNQPPFWDTDEITIGPVAVFDEDYPEGKLVVEFNYYRARQFVPQGTPISDKRYWKPIPYFPIEERGWGSTLPNHGVISIYEKDANNIFTLIDTIISPFPATDEFYGSTVAFGEDTLLIGAEGAGQSTGRLYQMKYGKFYYATSLYNPLGSSGKVIKLSSVLGIEKGQKLEGIGFTDQTVESVDADNSTITISRVPDSTPLGNIKFYVNTWQYVPGPGLSRQKLVADELQVGSKFAFSLSVSQDASVLLASAPGTTTPGKVIVFNKNDLGQYVFAQKIQGTDVRFGEGITASNNGLYIAMSSVLYDGDKVDQGIVDIYKKVNGLYQKDTSLTNTNPETAQLFGNKISFMNDYDTLVVYSINGDTLLENTFDRYSEKLYPGSTEDGMKWINDASSANTNSQMILDNSTTRIITPNYDSGRVDIFDRYANKWVFSESLKNTSGENSAYGSGMAVGSNVILVTAPYAVVETTAGMLTSGKTFEYRKREGTYGWTIVHKQIPRPDVSKIRKAFLYNKKSNQLITYLDVIDPAQGKIPGPAEQELKYKTYYDPAIYSVGDSTVNVDDGMAWTKLQVGTLWWDLRTAKFYDNYDEDIVYRNSLSSTLFEGASIDVYEWVETNLTPEKWIQQADTEAGVALGISGTPLYGNTVYSIIRKYDNVSQSFKNTYYYWVKNKKTTPNVPFRKISAQDVASLIANPRGMGYKYLELTGPNSFSLVNISNLLTDSDVVLSVDYWTVDKTDNNVHSQWAMISNNVNSKIPKAIEQKWFDSLCGKDESGRVLPDTTLPIKLRYGIESKPRQSMFINRFEALKQVIEHANRVMLSKQIVDRSSLKILNTYEVEPSFISGEYDAVFDTDAELRFANVGTFTVPSLTPVIVNGRITGIEISQSGFGYSNAPFIDVSGTGTGAILRSTIDSKGRITGVTVVSSGEGYSDDTVLTVRNYCVLIHKDSKSLDRWSIYSYDVSTLTWSRIKTQSYDTRKYWNKVDWYGSYTDIVTGISTSYNQLTAINYAVDTFNDLQTINPGIGQTVKIRTTSTGDWILLRKYQESDSIDWTQTYAVIGQQNGTIQIDSTIYSFIDTVYGYDGSLYDGSIFDNSAAIEIRQILKSLRDEIFIDDLRSEYLNLFFSNLRYVLTEQNLIDWAFKTSFVRAQHNLGKLDQPVTYKTDNLSDFESYIAEVKPYRTKIREYVSNYDGVEYGKFNTTDFDVLPYYGEPGNTVTSVLVDGAVVSYNALVNQYPWKNWFDNLGFQVTEIKLLNPGSGYRSPPVVNFVGLTGTGATAKALISGGKISRIVLISKGSGYVTAPKVVIEGGLGVGGTAASAVAIVGNGKTRSNLIKIKFDRINQRYFITDLKYSETFSGSTVVSGNKKQFPLTWAPDSRLDASVVSSVTINGTSVLRSSYKLSTIVSTSRGYTSYSGAITFNDPPAAGSTVIVNYTKSWQSLTAADRIQYYYEPAEGELGKDLSILMTGIDYGGVNINGLSFDTGGGWGAVPYFSDKWDSFDPTFDDYIITVAANTRQFRLPYVPEDGLEINIYHSKIVEYDYVSDGVEKSFGYDQATAVDVPVVTATKSVPVVGFTSAYTSTPILNLNATGFSQFNTLTVQSKTGLVEGMVVKGATVAQGTYIKSIPTNATAPYVITLTRPLVSDTSGTVIFGGNIIKVASTSGIEPGMLIKGSGFTQRQLVSKVVDSTTLILNVEPNGVIGNGSNLYFTKNYKGKDIVRLANTDGLRVNDIVTLSPDPATMVLGYNCKILKIINNTDIQLDQILFEDISEGYNLEATRELVVPTDCTIERTGIVRLVTPLLNGTRLKLTLRQTSIRIDDPYFDLYDGETVQPNGRKTASDGTVMSTVVGNGENYGPLDVVLLNSEPIRLPLGYEVKAGDIFIFRKSTSDGSVKPLESDYDTSLTGGDLAYSTASGLAADDIIVDGDGLITPTTSPAPEEVVPGQVVDALSIKVFDKPNLGSAKFIVQNYLGDGSKTKFDIGQTPNSTQAVIVKDASEILIPRTDYTIDYNKSQIVFDNAPADGQRVSIFSLGFAGSNILDIDYFIGDGTTLEFITKAPWVDTGFRVLVYVDGIVTTDKTPVFFKTDATYQEVDRIGMKFSVAPVNGALINFLIVSGNDQTFPITHQQVIIPNGTLTYDLNNIVGVNLPLESNMIVRVDQEILPAPVNSYFTIKNNRLTYKIDPTKFTPYSIETQDIVVIADNDVLNFGTDYTIDLGGISVKLIKTVYSKYVGKPLIVSVTQRQSYTYIPAGDSSPAQIVFKESYNNPQRIYVTSFYNHNVLDIRRTELTVTQTSVIESQSVEFFEYVGLSGGNIVLDRTIINDYYMYLVRNGTLLTPTVDFKLDDDRKTIILAEIPQPDDRFTVITFGSTILTPGISYQQFKDMLNRVHFKRLSSDKRTILTKQLNLNDTTIEVEDASNFDVPNTALNKPGIIEIRGERIEYFTITSEVKNPSTSEEYTLWTLGQLRRGTLGTGAPKIHKAGSYVQDIGASSTIPYSEDTIVNKITSDGTTTVTLDFVPASANEIDVFVGGYDSSTEWEPNTDYTEGTILTVGSYTYKVLAYHMSGETFASPVSLLATVDGRRTVIKENELSRTVYSYFVENIRLKKAPYKAHDVGIHPESPEGDITLPADFTVDGITNKITLTNKLLFGTTITVIRKKGVDWDGKTTRSLLTEDSKIARFLREKPGIWYSTIDKYEIKAGISYTLDSVRVTIDNDITKINQGQ